MYGFFHLPTFPLLRFYGYMNLNSHTLRLLTSSNKLKIYLILITRIEFNKLENSFFLLHLLSDYQDYNSFYINAEEELGVKCFS